MQGQLIGKLIILMTKKINRSERNLTFSRFFVIIKEKWSVCDDVDYGGTLVDFNWYFILFN